MRRAIKMGRKILNFTKWPLWLKTGIFIGFFITGVVVFLPDRFTNLAYVPWYLAWLVLPAFIIFSALCIFFRVDFISNFQPSEGPWRHIMLPVFWIISLFVISFIIGVVVGLLINFVLKRISAHPKT
jgi:hypothetical protein